MKKTGDTTHQDRIEKVLKRAKNDVAVKDMLTLFFARFFTVIAALLAPLFAYYNISHKE